jgi:hypothetical protein
MSVLLLPAHIYDVRAAFAFFSFQPSELGDGAIPPALGFFSRGLGDGRHNNYEHEYPSFFSPHRFTFFLSLFFFLFLQSLAQRLLMDISLAAWLAL